MENIKEQIRELILKNGADLCGFASADDFAGAPEGFSPKDIYPRCKSVIVFAVASPASLAEIKPRLIYGYFNSLNKDITDKISLETSKQLYKRFGISALPVPCDGPYDYWLEDKKEGRGLLDMKTAAVLAGIGKKGKSTLLLNETYGNMITIGAILADTELASDGEAESICIEGCKKCMESCPVGAISQDGHVDQKKCRENTYGVNARGFETVECNACRTVCPMRNGRKKK